MATTKKKDSGQKMKMKNNVFIEKQIPFNKSQSIVYR